MHNLTDYATKVATNVILQQTQTVIYTIFKT